MQDKIGKIINLFKELINIIEKELPERYRLEAFRILASRILSESHHTIPTGALATKEKTIITPSPEEIIEFGEFVGNLKDEPKNNMERLTILVYYLTKYVNPGSKYVELDKELVEHYFTEVGWKVPANLGRDLNKAIREKRYLARSEKGIYLIKPGREYVERLLADEGVNEHGKS